MQTYLLLNYIEKPIESNMNEPSIIKFSITTWNRVKFSLVVGNAVYENSWMLFPLNNVVFALWHRARFSISIFHVAEQKKHLQKWESCAARKTVIGWIKKWSKHSVAFAVSVDDWLVLYIWSKIELDLPFTKWKSKKKVYEKT